MATAKKLNSQGTETQSLSAPEQDAGDRYSGIRESRPYTYSDCGGNSIQLAGEFKKRCLKMADRSFSQGLQCQQINSMSALMSMDDSVFIVHSPLGCAGCSTMASDLYQKCQTDCDKFG